MAEKKSTILDAGRVRGEVDRYSVQAVPMAAILAQFDRMPDRTDAFDPLVWDELGLPI